jgi:predicted membrane protein (TIGR00267 family)
MGKKGSTSMPTKKLISLWNEYLQDEIDAAYLYSCLTALQEADDRRDLFSKLENVEKKHIQAWKDFFDNEDVTYEISGPTVKARLMSWIAKHVSRDLIERLVLREESNEVKAYLRLHRRSGDPSTQKLAKQLAGDSAEHADMLSTLLNTDSEPWHSAESGGLVRDIVYGFNDGLTANFGLIAGVIGAKVSAHFILISGISGMIADALSMGSSGFLAAMSEKEVFEHEKAMEAEEIRVMPELETEELAIIYEMKGLSKEKAQQMAEEIMKTPKRALSDMVHEELGLAEPQITPLKEGWVTGLATAVGALIPVIPFMFWHGMTAIIISFIISMLTHFMVGAARSFFTGRSLIRSGFDMFVVGFGVAVAGYLIGDYLLAYLR